MQDELNDMSGADKPIEIKIYGPKYKVLRKLAEKIGEKYEKGENTRGKLAVSRRSTPTSATATSTLASRWTRSWRPG